MHSPYFPSILGLQCLVPFLYCIINLTFASFSPSYSHSICEFSVFLSFFFSHINVASSFYSIDLLSAFCCPSHSRLLISYPRPMSLSPRVAVELNRAQQPVLQTKKRFRRCLSRPFPFFFYHIPPFSLVSIARLCVILQRNNVAAKPGQSSFLNLSWDNRLGVII